VPSDLLSSSLVGIGILALASVVAYWLVTTAPKSPKLVLPETLAAQSLAPPNDPLTDEDVDRLARAVAARLRLPESAAQSSAPAEPPKDQAPTPSPPVARPPERAVQSAAPTLPPTPPLISFPSPVAEKKHTARNVAIVLILIVFIIAVVVVTASDSGNKGTTAQTPGPVQLHSAFVSAQQLTSIYGESYTEVAGGSSQLNGSGLLTVENQTYINPPSNSVVISIGQYNSAVNASAEYSALFSNTGASSTGNHDGVDYKIDGFGIFDMAVLTGGNYTFTIEFSYGAMGSNEVNVIQAQISVMS
jgi:hypothetical protein